MFFISQETDTTMNAASMKRLGAMWKAARRQPRTYKSIVKTGGPCSGKTTAMSYNPQRLTERGSRVFVMPEVATDLITRGMDLPGAAKAADWRRYYAYEDAIVMAQMYNEVLMDHIIRATPPEGRPQVLLHDRGLADAFAYYRHDEQKMRTMSELGLVPADLYNYDCVIHLVTAADGAEEYYTTANNKARHESPKEAREIDKSTQRIWLPAAHYGTKLVIIDNSTDFERKMKRTHRAICQAIGIPAPVEKERWFAVRNRELPGNIPAIHTELDIEQIYLRPDTPESERRVRRLSHGGIERFFLTEKRPGKKPDERIETSRPISDKVYEELRSARDPERETIHKRRICFLHENQYFELDVFRHPHSGRMKLEIETIDDDQEIRIPDWIDAVEVTKDKRFSNAALSRKGSEFPSV